MNPIITLVTYFTTLIKKDYEVLCHVSVPSPYGTIHKYVTVTGVEPNHANTVLFVDIYDEDLKTTGKILLRKNELEERIVILDPDTHELEIDHITEQV